MRVERGDIEDEGEKRPRRGQTKYQKRQLKLNGNLATSLSQGTAGTQEHSHLSRRTVGNVGSWQGC